MKDCLLTYCSTHVATWDQFLTGVIWAYNSSLNPVTGFSPHYLMMGREPRQPVDILEGSYNEIKHDYAQYSTNLTMHLKQALSRSRPFHCNMIYRIWVIKRPDSIF
jgi:hypothetical protein